MANRIFKFGDSIFPVGTSVVAVERGRTIGSAKLARATGMRQTAGYRNGIRVEMNVPIVRGPLDTSDHWTRLAALRAMLAVGPANLMLLDEMYYRCCEPAGEPEEIPETGYNRIHQVRVTMVGPDPFLYSTGESSTTWTPTSGGTQVLSPGGNASSLPTFNITVGGSGLETIAFTITNSTTEEEFTLEGDVTAGDVIVVNCLAKSCKIGTTDRLDLFEGIFPSLDAGSNTITTAWTASSITSITATFRNRWE